MNSPQAAPLGDDLLDALDAFARLSVIVVALDFDGTLAPLVADPSASRALPEADAALRRLTELEGVSVALVSGRQLNELRSLADPPREVVLVGSHGAEVDTPEGPDDTHGVDADSPLDDAARSRLADVVEAVGAVVASHEGTALERKPTGAVLHTRRAEADVAEHASAQVLTGPATLPGVTAMRGKQVVELSVVDADKGSALDTLRSRVDAKAVLYAGDDVTDENAFAACDDDAGDVTIKVGDGDTGARWRVGGPPQIAAVLERVLAIRLAG